MEIEQVGLAHDSAPSASTIGVAVKGTRNSRYALKWALDRFISEGRIRVMLVHARPKIKMVPTPMGNFLPISKVRDDVAAAYMKDIECQTSSMLLPYKKMCAARQVEVEAVVIEEDDIAEAISKQITKLSVDRLVIGASSGNVFTRKSKDNYMSSKISRRIPWFCTVYVVSKGKLSSVQASTSGKHECTFSECDHSVSSGSFSSHFSNAQSEYADTDSVANSHASHLLTLQIESPKPDDTPHTRSIPLYLEDYPRSSSSNVSDIQYGNSTISSYSSTQTDNESLNSYKTSTSDILRDSSFSGNKVNIEYELERLRTQLRHLQGLCEIAQNESVDASQELNELNALRMKEAVKLKDMTVREENLKEAARREREKREAAEKEALFVRECLEREALLQKNAEVSYTREANEKQRLEKVLARSDEQYKNYTWEEIESSTSSFSETLRIGTGANGIVYKASFHHTVAAVKILHSSEGYEDKQFKQELDVLGRIRHPHLLLLLGACPGHGCLVYEYMENGSLDDRLQCKNNTPPLPWHHRYRIAWEVASALVFLHNSKPEPIIHRDLKPANILLDQHYVSKIGDVGLSTLLPTMSFSMSTMYKDTAPVGTFFYIDPEYQRTGQVSPKSDTFALGMVILQLLTAKPPMGLTYVVETALESGSLTDILDPGAGKWPIEETQELALLGLSCLELRRKDRPDLKDQVLPMLERLKGKADKAQNEVCNAPSVPPVHFICPILKEVMIEPCLASDGYTYERRAIEKWFSMNDKSPMTNMLLPNKILVPNKSLLSAIKEWKSRTPSHCETY